jgi:hypothetical protein
MSSGDDASGAKIARGPRREAATALPLQLGKKLREVFGDGPAPAPMPDRLQELLDALAVKEQKPNSGQGARGGRER